VIDIARNINKGSHQRVPSRVLDEQNIEKLKIMPMEDIVTKYYLRFMVADKPGILSKIAGILGEKSISIASVIQKGRMYDGSAVPIVMVTHNSKERNIRLALNEIGKLDIIQGEIMLLRIGEEQASK
ncbi:MAG: ACT domain-containing protein, partial [Deltaproteobacteria bacterium]